MKEKQGIKKIKNYRLLREAGRGANGVIYESIDDSNQKRVAIKAIPAEKITEKHILESFKNELRALHKLNHVNIIKLYGVEKTVSNIYLVLEYANGGNLQQYLTHYQKKNKNQLPVKTVQFLIKNITSGLEYMHKNNMIHRDLKLDNILLHFKNADKNIDYDKVDIMEATILIADLGYAKILENAFDETKSICGTPIIMAPEMINLRFMNNSFSKKLTYNFNVDKWSLGAITYQLLFGIPPFLAKNVNELFKEIMKGKYIISSNIKLSIETVTFINGLLQFYPEKRFEWNVLRSHPFLRNSVESFHELELDQLQLDGEFIKKKIEIDSKDSENLLWMMFKLKKKNINLENMSMEFIQNDKLKKEKEREDNMNKINKINESLEINETMMEGKFDKELPKLKNETNIKTSSDENSKFSGKSTDTKDNSSGNTAGNTPEGFNDHCITAQNNIKIEVKVEPIEFDFGSSKLLFNLQFRKKWK